MSAVPQSELDSTGPHELQRLKAVHYLIMDMHLRGMSNVQIAEELDRSSVGIGLIIQCPLFQQELARRREHNDKTETEQRSLYINRAKEVLTKNAENAATKLVEQLDHIDPNIQQRASFGILDRVFPKEPKDGSGVNNFNGPVMVLGPEALQLLKQAQNEDADVVSSRTIPSRVVDQEPVPTMSVPQPADAESVKPKSDCPQALEGQTPSL
jgi:CheY-like chemotaxis protein